MLCHKLIRSCSTFHHSAGWECQAALKRNISGTQLVWNPVVCHSLDDWQQTNPDIGQSPTLLWFFRSFFKHLCNYPTIYRKRKGKKSCMSPLSVMRLNHKNAYQYQSLFIIHIHVKNFQSIFFLWIEPLHSQLWRVDWSPYLRVFNCHFIVGLLNTSFCVEIQPQSGPVVVGPAPLLLPAHI